MEAGEENGGNSHLKRQRAPLSDSEDNVLSPSEVNDGQKRRRLEASGQENRSPKPSSSGRIAELETKPDTPMVPSVRSRVQELTQRRGGAALPAQRCLSDPGAHSLSVNIQERGFREHLLSEGEFNQRMERFKVPVFQASPAPTESPADPCPRTCSNFVSGIQQKLQDTTTPSSEQASRMRDQRNQELSRLRPISENAWLKRSSSDPSLTQQADGDAEMKDGSFTEALTSGTERHSSDSTGKRAPCDSETPTGSGEVKDYNEGQLVVERKGQSTLQCGEVGEKTEHKASIENEKDQLRSQQLQSPIVLKLSLSKDQSFSRASFSEDLGVSELPTGDDQSLLGAVSKPTEQGASEMFSFEEVEEIGDYQHSEDEIEPSTDEELKFWRYPQDNVCMEEESKMGEQEEYMRAKEEEGQLESSRVENEKGGSIAHDGKDSDIRDSECYLANVSAEIAGSFETQEDEKPIPEEDELRQDSCLDDSVKDQLTSNKDQGNIQSCYEGALRGDTHIFSIKQDQQDTEPGNHRDDVCQQSKAVQTVSIKEEDMDPESDGSGPNGIVKETRASPLANVAQALNDDYTKLETNMKDVAKLKVETLAKSTEGDGSDGDQCLTEVEVSDHPLETKEMEQVSVGKSQGVVGRLTENTHESEGGESSKKVTFILEPELINDSTLSETNTSMESRADTSVSVELSSHDETNTAEVIDQMFEEVLEYAGRMQGEGVEDEDTEDHDSGIGVCPGDKDKMDMESEKEKSEEEHEGNGDELLTFPPSGILSPLSKSVEAVVTPLRLAVSQESNPPSLLLTPGETSTPPAESAPLYSIDAYRTQRQIKPSTIQSVTPGVQRRAPVKSQPQPSVNTKEKITVIKYQQFELAWTQGTNPKREDETQQSTIFLQKALNEEAGKLQTIINQTLQALSCCTDEEHGRGSLEEAEAEKLLLVSCEKRSALLAEVARLREERNSESGEAAGEDEDIVSQQPCRGTVAITNIQLPLKVEFVCSSHNRSGRPSHYFFILIRYGPCNIVATPLATAADAQNGDTISFPTSVTLKDIRSSFEIDVEVYSLSHTSGSNCSTDRTTTKSRVTPRKLLNTITRSSNSLTSAPPAVNTRRSSNFCLVGSHKITLASLGHSKFPLDKMKLEGKIRRLLGDEFQEKVPFLSPLEGNIYLRLNSESHSNVQHQGFLTMFELISGYGVWHRRYFVLEECNMYYWNHPNDKETKEAEGSISLSNSLSQSVRPVKRDSCARPFTFELVSSITQQQKDDSQEALSKCWFAADTKQERLDWMEKLNQVLLDFHTWNRTSKSEQLDTSSSGNLRESIL